MPCLRTVGYSTPGWLNYPLRNELTDATARDSTEEGAERHRGKQLSQP